MKTSSDSVCFWGDDDIIEYFNQLVILRNPTINPIKEWPGIFPSVDDILHELSISRQSYITIKTDLPRKYLTILTGRIVVKATIFTDNNQWSIRLNNNSGIIFASNKLRSQLLSRSVRVKHDGIMLVTNEEFKQYAVDDYWSSGDYCIDLDNLVENGMPTKYEISVEEEYEEIQALEESEEQILNTLQQVVEAEYDMEEQTARETAPFAYFNLESEARPLVYRSFFTLSLDPEDLDRLRDLKPSVLRIENSADIDIIAAVVNLAPYQDKPQISISIEKQISADAIPRSGLLWLTALPTLKNVRSSVVDNLRGRQSPNQWLVPVSGQNYSYKKLVPMEVPRPNSNLPPNESQINAINSGAGTDDYLLVLGPPGTGKTTVILRWVEYFVSQGKRVLVTSQNNKAVDNVLERLAEEKTLDCVRLGDETKVSSSVKNILIDNYATTIQQKLISDIDSTLANIKNIVSYLDNLNNTLKMYDKLSKSAISFEDRARDIRTKIIPNTNKEITNLNNSKYLLEKAVLVLSKELTDTADINNKISKIINFTDFKISTNDEWSDKKYISIVNKSEDANNLEKEAVKLYNKNFKAACSTKNNLCANINKHNKNISDININIDYLIQYIEEVSQKNIIARLIYKPSIFFKHKELKKANIELEIEMVKLANQSSKLSKCNKNGLDLVLKISNLDLKAKSIRLNEFQSKISEIAASLTKLQDIISAVSKESNDCDHSATKVWDEGRSLFGDVPKSILKSKELFKIEFGRNFSYHKYEAQRAYDSKVFDNVLKIIEGWHSLMSSERQQALYGLLLSFVDVVGATCIGINTNRAFKDVVFDVVIVDESGQIQLQNVMVPLSRGPKAILVGDHKQLPPVVQQELLEEMDARGDYDQDLIKKSWFELLWDQSPDDRKIMLDTQFRCPSIISNFISKAYYDDKYYAGLNTITKSPIFSFFSSTLVFIDTSKIADRYENPSDKTNPTETRIVLNVLSRALEELPYLGSGEAGIIVPYKNHVMEIRNAIRKHKNNKFKSITAPLDEFVATVDSFQGQERDLIIFPFTRSNKAGKIGFVKDWRRLNVAMTRTKKQLVMIGDISTLTMESNSKEIDEMEVYFRNSVKQLVEYTKQFGQFIDATKLFSGTENSTLQIDDVQLAQ